MGRVILFLLMTLSLHAQSITVSGTTYQIMDNDEMLSDPNTYLYMFMKDASERGHNFDDVRGTFRYYDGGGAGFSVRAVGCRGSFEIGLQNYYWSTQGFWGRRNLIYHELGHALLRLAHVCYSFDGTFPESYRSYQNHPDFEFYSGDVMWALRQCDRTARHYQVIPLTWDEKLDRMFNPGYQRYHSCGSSKSSTPILDY